MTLSELKNLARQHGWDYQGYSGKTHQWSKLGTASQRSRRFEAQTGDTPRGPYPMGPSKEIVSFYGDKKFTAITDHSDGVFDNLLRNLVQS